MRKFPLAYKDAGLRDGASPPPEVDVEVIYFIITGYAYHANYRYRSPPSRRQHKGAGQIAVMCAYASIIYDNTPIAIYRRRQPIALRIFRYLLLSRCALRRCATRF